MVVGGLGSPSGRISGVVKNTPSGVGLGVGVTATCAPAADRSWMPHQHGEVLMHGVVAVVDVRAAVLAELDLERDPA